jgi:hypothetical protein
VGKIANISVEKCQSFGYEFPAFSVLGVSDESFVFGSD